MDYVQTTDKHTPNETRKLLINRIQSVSLSRIALFYTSRIFRFIAMNYSPLLLSTWSKICYTKTPLKYILPHVIK